MSAPKRQKSSRSRRGIAETVEKAIAVLSCLDNYSKQITFLKECIEQRGHRTILIDLSMGGEPQIKPDITCQEIAQAGGARIEDIRASSNRQEINWTMINGAITKVTELCSAGDLNGLIAVGGATTAFMGSSIMKALPFGLPKLLVSSSAAVPGFAENYFGTKDITLMDSVIDIGNLNAMVRGILTRAAGAICGMMESLPGPTETVTQDKPVIALSMLGNCEHCAKYVTEHLEQRGYEVISFHAQGVADRLMEELIERGLFVGVIDLCPGGIIEELFGGIRASGPNRLEAAGKRGIPQVITPSSLEFIGPPISRYESEYKSRKAVRVDDLRVAVRSTAEELVVVARTIADKLNQARGPVKFLIPLQGWSLFDGEGKPLYDPEADRAFVEELRKCLKPEIEIREIDAWLEDPEFAVAVVCAFDEVMSGI